MCFLDTGLSQTTQQSQVFPVIHSLDLNPFPQIDVQSIVSRKSKENLCISLNTMSFSSDGNLSYLLFLQISLAHEDYLTWNLFRQQEARWITLFIRFRFFTYYHVSQLISIVSELLFLCILCIFQQMLAAIISNHRFHCLISPGSLITCPSTTVADPTHFI